MRIGVIEIMENGHLELAETLCRIFCSDQSNRVFLLTLEKHAQNLLPLSKRYPNLELITGTSGDCDFFFRKANDLSLDHIFLATLIRYFREASKWKPRSPLHLVIHNLDEWFSLSFARSMQKFAGSLSTNLNLKIIIYSFKTNFIYNGFRKRILGQVSLSGGKLVVLSEAVRNELIALNPGIPEEVIPFSVFEPAPGHADKKPFGDQPLRICVPGILSQYRRDYLGLLDLLEEGFQNLKEQFIIDFLGGVHDENPLDRSKLIVSRIEKLRAGGFTIIYHPVKFIPPEQYEHELSLSDLILGNMNLDLNKFSRYGKTKETGLPFAMIKAAKPGILPENYSAPEELASGILRYHNKEELAEILARLISDRKQLSELKDKALENSKQFTPAAIYKRLMNSYHNG